MSGAVIIIIERVCIELEKSKRESHLCTQENDTMDDGETSTQIDRDMHPLDKEIIRVISRFVQSYTIQVEKEEKDEVQEAEEDEDKL